MPTVRFLDVDNKKKFSKFFVLNDLLNINIQVADKAVINIKEGKKTWFPYLAIIDKKTGGWKQPNEEIDWINIPSPDNCIITQIPLSPPKKDNLTEKDVFAVFVCKEKTKKSNVYEFFGIFQFSQMNNGFRVWTRKKSVLDIEDWKIKK